ncbi:MAG TPA: hypothetical protein VEJ84_16050 [Acidimicrobiales bacterium]|nr:hypothetical protein [Acidimicrobiales bacterium]
MHHGPREGRKGDNRPGAELIDDCEAFLKGHLVERIEDRADMVPAWAWTNLLAHGTVGELRAECAPPGLRRAVKNRRWRQARSHLAAQVLECATACGPLDEIQRFVLIPLELQLASRAEVSVWCPGRWIVAVETALTQRRQAGRCG